MYTFIIIECLIVMVIGLVIIGKLKKQWEQVKDKHKIFIMLSVIVSYTIALYNFIKIGY